MDLAGIGRLRGLDKIPEKIDLCTVSGAIEVGQPFAAALLARCAKEDATSLASPLYLLTLVGRKRTTVYSY
jgi:hypothetical protein